ncbi:MAG: hypothetical protein KJO57_13980, partial [Deltaproteobacteria bacterium]|nr:hypothetical protein [Deltaproteobacteria bacterium]
MSRRPPAAAPNPPGNHPSNSRNHEAARGHGVRIGRPVMTRPRIVDPGATLALSRRTTRRHFLLHPDEAREMEQIYWYC